MAEAIIEGQKSLMDPPATASKHASPAEYHTFSRKLAPALTAMGGVVVIIGGLGTWIRAAQATRSGDPLKDIGAGMGYTEPIGWVLAALGAAAVVGAFAWTVSGKLPKLLPIVTAIGIAGIAAWKLPLIGRQADQIVRQATKKLGFADFHAGFGWGSWLLLTGSVIVLLGAFAGILRELDVKRGISE